jgi:hypothetical protein
VPPKDVINDAEENSRIYSDKPNYIINGSEDVIKFK